MKRIIKDYDTMSEELRALVGRTFPDGILRDDLMTFPTATGKRFYGVEVRTEDTVYIIKGSFTQAVERKGFFVVDDEDDDLDEDFIEVIPPTDAFKDEDEDEDSDEDEIDAPDLDEEDDQAGDGDEEDDDDDDDDD